MQCVSTEHPWQQRQRRGRASQWRPQLPAAPAPPRPAPAIEQGQHNTAPAQLSYTPGTTRTTQSGQSGSEIFGCTQNGAKTSTSALPLLLSQFHTDQ